MSDPRVRAAMDRGEPASVLLDTRHSRPLCQVLQANSSDRITRAKVAGVVRGIVCVVCALKKSKTPNHLSSQSQEQLTSATLEVVAHITVCNRQFCSSPTHTSTQAPTARKRAKARLHYDGVKTQATKPTQEKARTGHADTCSGHRPK